MKFSNEEIKMPAQLERDMDNGKQPFVVSEGGRTAVSVDCMEALGLEQGQTINQGIFEAILRYNLEQIEQCKNAH